MLKIVLSIWIAALGGLAAFSTDFRDRLNDLLTTAGMEVELLHLAAQIAFRRFIIGSIVISSIYLTILISSIILEYTPVTIFLWIILASSLALLMFAFFFGSFVLRFFGNNYVRNTGVWLARIQPVVEVSPAMFTGGTIKSVVGGLFALVLMFMNILWIVPALTVKATGLVIVGFSDLSFGAAKSLWWLSRLMALFMIWALTLMSIQLFGLMAGVNLVDMTVMFILGLMFLLYLPVARFLDLRLGMRGMPLFSAGLPAALALIFLILSLFAYKFPVMASGLIDKYWVIPHDAEAQDLNRENLENKKSDYTYYKVTKPIYVTFKKVGSKYVVHQSAENEQTPIYKKGDKGIYTGGLVLVKDTKTPDGKAQVYPLPNDKIAAEKMKVNIEDNTENYVYVDSSSIAPDTSASNNSSGDSANKINIPLNNFKSLGWDPNYGPHREYAGFPKPVGIWMGGAGEITFQFSISEIPEDATTAKLELSLSGEMHRDPTKVEGDGTSNVQVKLNDVLVPDGSVNAMPDNDKNGQQYSFKIPASSLRAGQNTLTLVVQEGGKKNGLNVWAIRPDTAAVLTF